MNNVYMDGPAGGVPQITGKWYNKRTGQTIFVRDAYFMDDGMQVQTSTGDFIDGQTFSNEYIQIDEQNIYDESGKVVSSDANIDFESMFGNSNNYQYIDNSNVNAVIDLNEPEVINSTINTTIETTLLPNETDINNVQGENTSKIDKYKLDILDKFFNSFKELPEIKFTVKWNKLPEYEINLMKTVFNVSEDDIAIYITEKYCDNQTIIESIKDDIKLKLDPKKEVVKKSSKKPVSPTDNKKEKLEVKEIDEAIDVEKEPVKEIKKIPSIKGRKPSKR